MCGQVLPKDLSHEEKALGTHQPINPLVTALHRRNRFHIIHPAWFRNSLLPSTGFLEFANAGDFAANVWNEIPVPRHAMILMAIGGPLALMMSLVALRDGLLSWQNVRLLRNERQYLTWLKHEHLRNPTPDHDLLRLIDCRLGVGVRELGTELVDRIAMDILLGIGALLVGTGTIMAIWGAHPKVFHASNLLSGFVGNGFAAAFGVINAIWSVYLVVRFHRHDTACLGDATLTPFRRRLHARFRGLKWHAIASGTTGLVAGAASMITAKRWWGYVILIPCMLLQVACNWLWRVHLGYDRPVVFSSSNISLAPDSPPISPAGDEEKTAEGLSDRLASTLSISNALGSLPTPATDQDCSSLDALLRYTITHGLFDSLCAWIAHDRSVPDDLRRAVFRFPSCEGEFSVSYDDIIRLPQSQHAMLRDLVGKFLRGDGCSVLRSRELYLMELLGCSASMVDS
ncbi:hypothetical protein BDV59DRAFT_204938 [Aspergillus ambiguus]|uniref:uncharacterized protein n=1 Tax=Aspergillus ambiguus TaxID=176160 RepID=UPI003CCE098D